jgi:hypothetical protein
MKRPFLIPFLMLSLLLVAFRGEAQAAEDKNQHPMTGLFAPETAAFPLVIDVPDVCSDEGSQMREAVFAELFKMKFENQCTSLAIRPLKPASGRGKLCEFKGLNAFDFSLVEPVPDTHEPLLVSLGLSDYRLNLLARRSVERNIKVLSQDIRGRFTIWLARSGRYVRMMKSILREEGIPEDMVWLSLIESGFNTRAYSRRRAAGPWQFIEGTGKRYGLTINWWVDERRDPVKSTRAAARYLRDLHEMFGSWSLAMASYNAGENKIKRAIRRTGSKDYWRLLKTSHIRQETKNYVPKFIAARLIAVNPEQYGFGDIKYHDGFTYDEVEHPTGSALYLEDSAGHTGALSRQSSRGGRGTSPERQGAPRETGRDRVRDRKRIPCSLSGHHLIQQTDPKGIHTDGATTPYPRLSQGQVTCRPKASRRGNLPPAQR